jgi:hypothetical protein
VPDRAIVLGVTLALLTACGGGDGGDRAPEDVARRYVASEDPAKCDDATQALLERNSRRRGAAARKACREAVARFDPPAGVKVTGKEVEGNRARVDLRAGGQDVTVSLTRDGDRWRVSALGR